MATNHNCAVSVICETSSGSQNILILAMSFCGHYYMGAQNGDGSQQGGLWLLIRCALEAFFLTAGLANCLLARAQFV